MLEVPSHIQFKFGRENVNSRNVRASNSLCTSSPATWKLFTEKVNNKLAFKAEVTIKHAQNPKPKPLPSIYLGTNIKLIIRIQIKDIELLTVWIWSILFTLQFLCIPIHKFLIFKSIADNIWSRQQTCQQNQGQLQSDSSVH